MSRTLTLISHAATAATRAAAFPADEPIERPNGSTGPVRMDAVVRGPETRCAQTAELLGLTAQPEQALRDCDYGRWQGRALDTVAAAEPLEVTGWLTDPTAAPHGGESIVDVLGRVGDWLDAPPEGRRIAAITHPAIIKAAIVRILNADPSAFWRIDISPFSRTILRGEPGRWTLRQVAVEWDV